MGLGAWFWGFVDRTGQDRMGLRVSTSGFWAWWVVLGYGGLGLGAGRMFWVWADSFWACAGWCRDWALWVLGMWSWGLGWDRLGSRVGGSGFGARWVVLGHVGLGYGIGGGNIGCGGQIFGFGGLYGCRPQKKCRNCHPRPRFLNEVPRVRS